MDILEKALEKLAQANDSMKDEEDISDTYQPHNVIQKKANQPHNVIQKKVNIDWKKIEDQGFLSSKNGNIELVEEFRVIKRPLINNAFGQESKNIKRANLILVTSSLPSEGKTFCAIILALSIVNERDKKVLLIDADVSKPSIADRLGIESTVGLIEYLESDDLSFSDISLKTNLDGLQVIPAGKRHAFSTELLSSNKMAQFVDELSQRYPDRVVIFDSPPLLAATQAEVLASLVGQVVFVIAAETTLQSSVDDAIKKIESVDIILAVLNKAKKGFNSGHYGYGQYGH